MKKIIFIQIYCLFLLICCTRTNSKKPRFYKEIGIYSGQLLIPIMDTTNIDKPFIEDLTSESVKDTFDKVWRYYDASYNTTRKTKMIARRRHSRQVSLIKAQNVFKYECREEISNHSDLYKTWISIGDTIFFTSFQLDFMGMEVNVLSKTIVLKDSTYHTLIFEGLDSYNIAKLNEGKKFYEYDKYGSTRVYSDERLNPHVNFQELTETKYTPTAFSKYVKREEKGRYTIQNQSNGQFLITKKGIFKNKNREWVSFIDTTTRTTNNPLFWF